MVAEKNLPQILTAILPAKGGQAGAPKFKISSKNVLNVLIIFSLILIN
jgi:hypothetical protein